MYNNVYAFKNKIKLWITRIQEGKYEMFESFSLFLEINEVDIDNNSIKIIIENHLQSLHDTFENYHPMVQDIRDGYLWVQNLFLTNFKYKLCLKEQEFLL